MKHRILFNKLEKAIPPYLLNQIITHPFNEALYRGTLPFFKFRKFLEQDKLYLLDFSKALKNIAERLDNDARQKLFFELSNGAFNTHLSLHDKYLKERKSPQFFSSVRPITKKIPIIDRYTAYQFEMSAHAELGVAIASLMPCFVIYSYLGLYMQRQLTTKHPYQRWVESYSSEKFLLSTESIIHIAEELAKGKQPFINERMNAAFEKSAQFEISIWNAISISDLDYLPTKYCSTKHSDCLSTNSMNKEYTSPQLFIR